MEAEPRKRKSFESEGRVVQAKESLRKPTAPGSVLQVAELGVEQSEEMQLPMVKLWKASIIPYGTWLYFRGKERRS